jgi:hypothetical protein
MGATENTYAIFSLRLHFPGKIVQTEALVYEGGAKRVFSDSEHPENINDMIGKIVQVELRDFLVQGVFTKEITQEGVFYNIRFLKPPETVCAFIREAIRKKGVPTPWQRKLPRIPINRQENKMPAPLIAVVNYNGQSFFLNIINFTVGGLLLESSALDMQTVSVGTVLEFDLLINHGEQIAGLTAQVMHISEDFAEADHENVRLYGVKFFPMNLLNQAKYNKVIKDYCEAWKANQ